MDWFLYYFTVLTQVVQPLVCTRRVPMSLAFPFVFDLYDLPDLVTALVFSDGSDFLTFFGRAM